MYEISYEIDYTDLKDFVYAIRTRLDRPAHLIEAIQTAGKYATQEWIKTANSKFKHSEGRYVQGILDGIQYPFNDNPLDLLIENKVPYARYLEEGTTSFDMKKALETSNKVRVSKKTGARYLIIPFRHGTPGSVTFRNVMPQDVYSVAKRLSPSFITGTYQEGVVQRRTPIENPIPLQKKEKYISDAEMLRQNNPQKVTRYTYKWGSRLVGVGGKYEGMVRFEKNVNIVREEFIKETSLGKFTYSRIVNKTTNNTAYSHYITFRAMSELSSGWIHPGIKGKYILKETVEKIHQPVIEMLKEAVKEDIRSLGF